MVLYTYTVTEGAFMIGWAILLFIIGILTKKCAKLKSKYEAVAEKYTDTQNMYDLSAEMCIRLQKELDDCKSREHIFKVEKIVSQPLELQYCIQFDPDFPEEQIKKFLYGRLCDELIKVFEENSDLCLIQEMNEFTFLQRNIRIRTRFLPYVSNVDYIY